MAKKLIGSAALTPSSDAGFDLTTKGDTHGYSDQNARIPISTNNFSLLCDSAESLGLKWASSPTSVLSGAQDILYSSAANTLARLAAGTAGKFLTTQGASSAPTWTSPTLSFIVSLTAEDGDATVADNLAIIRMPFAFEVTSASAFCNTAPTGSTLIFDITEATATIFSTKIRF